MESHEDYRPPANVDPEDRSTWGGLPTGPALVAKDDQDEPDLGGEDEAA